jgi:hypothetical protein
VVENLSFPIVSYFNIKETGDTIYENYSFSMPSLENEILTLFFSRLVLDKNRFGS